MHEILDRKGRLRASREELFEALSTEQFSAVPRFVADEIMQHIEQLEQRIARLDQYLLDGLHPWQAQLNLLQTIPGIDQIGAAMLLVEISADMDAFGSAERLARATMRALASARAGESAAATPGYVGCCASSRRPQHERAAPSRTSSRP